MMRALCLALVLAAPAFANRCVEHDQYGGATSYDRDNRGHSWTTHRSPWGGPDTIDEY